jgi:hypothetical protein
LITSVANLGFIVPYLFLLESDRKPGRRTGRISTLSRTSSALRL